jgi:hypothetical protein
MTTNDKTETRGRHSIFTPELGLAICKRISEGEGLRAICRTEGFPNPGTVYRWLLEAVDPNANDGLKLFSDQYTRAREHQAEVYADEIIEISDNSTNDTQLDDEGNEITNFDNIQRSRLRVDSRKWLAGKLRPKKYGDSMTHKGDIEQPMTQKVIVTHQILDLLTKEQLEQIRELVLRERAQNEAKMINVTPEAVKIDNK